MLILIKDDIFCVVKRIKKIDANYFVYYNTEKKRYELYYRTGLKEHMEIPLSNTCLTYLDYKKVCLSKTVYIDEILKQIENYNAKKESKNNALLQDELISKTKTLLRVGV